LQNPLHISLSLASSTAIALLQHCHLPSVLQQRKKQKLGKLLI